MLAAAAILVHCRQPAKTSFTSHLPTQVVLHNRNAAIKRRLHQSTNPFCCQDAARSADSFSLSAPLSLSHGCTHMPRLCTLPCSPCKEVDDVHMLASIVGEDGDLGTAMQLSQWRPQSLTIDAWQSTTDPMDDKVHLSHSSLIKVLM